MSVGAALARSLIIVGSMPVPFTSCWMWIRGYGSHGYGALRLPGAKSMTTAPRVAFEAWHGPLERGEVPRHTCDWKPCCNPAHLERGTQGDNVRDARARDLMPAKKLNEAIVRSIRRLHSSRRWTLEEIASRHGISYQCVQQIVKRQIWSHVT